MPTGTTRHDDDMLRLNQSVTIITKRRKNDAVVLRMFLVSKEATTHTILQTVRLVINLLQHKVIKTTLAQLADVQIHGLDIVMTGRMLQVDDIQLLTYPDVSNLTINQGRTSTVISTILQFLQPLNKNRISIILSYISNYSTHSLLSY